MTFVIAPIATTYSGPPSAGVPIARSISASTAGLSTTSPSPSQKRRDPSITGVASPTISMTLRASSALLSIPSSADSLRLFLNGAA